MVDNVLPGEIGLENHCSIFLKIPPQLSLFNFPRGGKMVSSPPAISKQSALNKRSISHIQNQIEKDEMAYEIKRLKTLNNMQLSRIDELHESMWKMEEKFKAISEELHNVRNFSIDLLVDYQQAINHAQKEKAKKDREAIEEYERELDWIYKEAIEWKEEQFCESEDLWKIIMECDPFDLDYPTPSSVDF